MEPAADMKQNNQKFSSLSPQRKDLTQLLNITAKFAGSGGSKTTFFCHSKIKNKTVFFFLQNYKMSLLWHPKRLSFCRNSRKQEYFLKLRKFLIFLNF